MSSRRGERPNLWMMGIDGGSPMQLTSDDGFEGQPEWSADGTRIAYQARAGRDERLLSIDVATRKAELMIDLAALRPSSGEAPDVAPLGEVRLSPSAKRIAFSVREPPTGGRVLYASALATMSPRRLTSASLSVGYPAWSPDERRVAVEIKDGSSTQAAVLDVETGVLRRITDARGQAGYGVGRPMVARWRRLCCERVQWSLHALDVSGGPARAITAPGPPRVFVRYPDWSARGDLIVFERAEMTGNIWLLDRRNDQR